ncbi:MAG: F0F1 ATP synthase subunit B [Candidatus Sumerlaeaceae bacterium]|nr:F0F1 ATP synthase subunit B [Candidatus Sumerlaeaceae bacterium]
MIAKILTTLVAFGLFFWIAKKLFWTSILKAIEDRQFRIKSEFDRIDSLQQEVSTMKADYSKRLADIEKEAQQRKQDEIVQGRKMAEEIVAQARQDAQAELERVKQNLAIETDKMRASLREEVVQLTLGATEKLIREKMDDGKQRQLVSQFVEELARK